MSQQINEKIDGMKIYLVYNLKKYDIVKVYTNRNAAYAFLMDKMQQKSKKYKVLPDAELKKTIDKMGLIEEQKLEESY